MNEYEPLHVEYDPAELDDDELRQVETTFFNDPARSVLSKNESPDVPFTYSLNPYRGCEHGCAYCYARPSHEYLGFSAGLDFETRILVKCNAPALLSERFQAKAWQPHVVSLSGNTAPYQPIERELRLTRRCLRVFVRHRNPVSLITKSGLIRHDIDVLRDLAEFDLVSTTVTITSLDSELVGKLEPRTARPALRLRTIEALAGAGIPVGVNVAPVIPGLTSEELPRILEAAAEAGATTAGYIVLRLPGSVRDVFIDWIERHYPNRKQKVLRAVKTMHGGTYNSAEFGARMRGDGERANMISQLFNTTCRKLGLNESAPTLSTDRFRQLPDGQRSLFE